MEPEEKELKPHKTKTWPAFLANPETRASHIGIIVVCVIIFVVALVLLPWAIYRTGGAASSAAEPEPNTKIIQRSNTNYTAIGNDLVDPITPGLHWITNMESIVSVDGRFELWLTAEGNAELWDHSNERLLYQSKTQNVTTPGQRFLMGIDGWCYIIRNDGTRSKNDKGEFWQSPNQIAPYIRDDSQGQVFSVKYPFQLTFYEDGLVMYSKNANNSQYTNGTTTKIPLWWVCATGIPPPGVLNKYCPNSNCPCTS